MSAAAASRFTILPAGARMSPAAASRFTKLLAGGQ